jgi:hypothetical protein
MNFRERELRKFYMSLKSSDPMEFLWYTNESGTQTTLRYYGAKTSVKVPSQIEDIQVTEIECTTFCGYPNITNVVIPDGVTKIM